MADKAEAEVWLRPNSESTLAVIRGCHVSEAHLILAVLYGNRSIGIKREPGEPGRLQPYEHFGTLMLHLDDNECVIDFIDLFEQRKSECPTKKT